MAAASSSSNLQSTRPYCGRFAPSPTGPLHFGSLVAAVGSYLAAKQQGGQWLVRIEDIDTPRNVPGADTEILRTLEAFGLTWDGTVIWQSQRLAAYQAALAYLIQTHKAYPCACSRKEIADSHARPALDGGLAYPGTCRNGLPPGRTARAWRLQVDDAEIGFVDARQGWQAQHLQRDVGDFVLRRADGLFAYQLAVVVDDAWQGITHIVRGADLLASTPRQIFLQQQLGYPTPSYTHLPLVLNAAGEKLSKQTRAPALVIHEAIPQLLAALAFLNFHPPIPPASEFANVAEVWAWVFKGNVGRERDWPLNLSRNYLV